MKMRLIEKSSVLDQTEEVDLHLMNLMKFFKIIESRDMF
jgi:hypothetical protein